MRVPSSQAQAEHRGGAGQTHQPHESFLLREKENEGKPGTLLRSEPFLMEIQSQGKDGGLSFYLLTPQGWHKSPARTKHEFAIISVISVGKHVFF